MPKYTLTVSLQMDIDTDTNEVLGFPSGLSDLALCEIIDWDGEPVEDETRVDEIANLLDRGLDFGGWKLVKS